MHEDDTVRVVKKRAANYAYPVGRPSAENICEYLPQLGVQGFRNVYNRRLSDETHEEHRADLLRCANSVRTAGVCVCVPPGALKKLVSWLRSFEQSERWTSMSSYSLKHIFERETGVYVPDGLFILGALMAGFTAKFWDDSQSAVFQMCRSAVR